MPQKVTKIGFTTTESVKESLELLAIADPTYKGKVSNVIHVLLIEGLKAKGYMVPGNQTVPAEEPHSDSEEPLL